MDINAVAVMYSKFLKATFCLAASLWVVSGMVPMIAIALEHMDFCTWPLEGSRFAESI